MEGFNRFAKGPTDREFMTRYYLKIIESKKFKDALKKSIKPKGPKIQHYNTEVLQSWNALMIEMGRFNPQTNSMLDKWSIAGQVNSVLEEIQEDSYEYRLLDDSRYIGAIKSGSTFYQVSYTKHTKPPVNPGEVIVSKKLNSFIATLGEKISEVYEVVVLKNNKVTVVDTEENFYSVNITKKKEALF